MMNDQTDEIHEGGEPMRETTVTDSNTTWICIGSGAVAKYAPSDDEHPSIVQPPEDLYSILATGSLLSIPFWYSILVIIGFQYLLVFLLLASQLNVNSDNLLNLPADVETFVRISQVLLIIIALFSQRDLLAGMESLVRGLPDHFRGNSRFVDMKRSQWRLSAIVRLIQGLLNFLASFVLAVQSDNVPDVLLNVLGVAFISDLDEMAFELCKKGYFGGSMKKISNDVCKVRFHRTAADIRKSIPTAKGGIKKIAHIISVFAVFLMALTAFTYLAIRQNAGVYLEQDILIEFGDEVLPFLGLFNGCYHMSDSRKENAGRLVYEQVGYPKGGKFGFCSDFGEGDGGWTFFIGEHREVPCGEDSYILRSGDTSTFSLLEAGKTKWYTYDDLPMDYLEITENKSPSTECGQLIFNSAKEACPSIEAFGTMSMKKLSQSVNAKSENSFDAAFSHPIYFSDSTDNGSFTLVFFTGRRWIRTKSDHIHGLGSETSVSHMERFFFERNGLFKFIDQLRASVDEEAELVSAVSEVVDTARDQGSPLGLLWYLPRHEGNIDAEMSETEKLQRNFPSANLARQIELDWTCLFCNDETNRCFHEGTCNPNNGTCFDCKHGWTGELCQEPPTGNGICNEYFNTAEYKYDGGDCCAGTCKGEDCGKDDLPDLFSGWGSNADWGYHYPFRNKTEEWKETFREREFAYGVNIGISGENLGISKRDDQTPPLRFSHCIDPNTALLTIEQTASVNDGILMIGQTGSVSDRSSLSLPGSTVRCNGNRYLQTPEFHITNNGLNHTFKEELRVPYGTRCEFSFEMTHPRNIISFFAKNQSVPFLKANDLDKTVVSLRIPESVCVWDTFAENIIPLMSDPEYEEFSRGVDLDSMCKRDPGELLERYVLWEISESLFADMSHFDGHVCDIEWKNLIYLDCFDSRRVSRLYIQVGAGLSDLPTGIGSMTHLTSLLSRSNHLTSLPSEIGRLTALTAIHLNENQLTSLPSEVGRLTTLSQLDLSRNQLESLPSEVGDLKLLTSLDAVYNPMTFYSLPIEVQNLGKDIIKVCDINHPHGYGCPLHDCKDKEGANSCHTFNSIEDCDHTGKNDCCKCGGGNITFTR